jgi:peptidoglycan/LPS O-acetylase OafA/YrhL
LLLVKSRKTFLTIFIFAIIAVPLMMILLNETVHHYIFYIFPAMRIVDFTIGIVLFQAFKYIKGKGIKLNYTIMELVSVVLLVLVYAYHSHVPEVFRYSVYYWPPIFLLILCFAFQKGRISRMLSNRWLVLLGEISFGFYLFHQLVIRYFLTINGKFVLLESELVIAIGLLFVSLLASYLGYIYIEKPANSLVKKKLIVQKKGLTPDLQIS